MIRVVNVRGLKGAARQPVCYVGRQCFGWPASPLANPFKVVPQPTKDLAAAEAARVVEEYRRWLLVQSDRDDLLRRLWTDCDHGAKPLGCWCVESTFDGEHVAAGKIVPVTCHAQVLAEALFARFVRPNGTEPRLHVDFKPVVWSQPERENNEIRVSFNGQTLGLSPERATRLADNLAAEVARIRAAQAAAEALTS